MKNVLIFFTIIIYTSLSGMDFTQKPNILTAQEVCRLTKRAIAQKNLSSEKNSFLYKEITALADTMEQQCFQTIEHISPQIGFPHYDRNNPMYDLTHGRHYLEFATTYCLKKYLLREFHRNAADCPQELRSNNVAPRKEFIPHLAAVSHALNRYKATIPRTNTVFVDFDPYVYPATCTCKPQCKDVAQFKKCPTVKHGLMRVHRCYYTDALPPDRVEQLREIDELGFGLFD
jgi:hypothetical protein